MPPGLLSYILYLAYGLVFFTMGVAIATRIARKGKLEIAGHFWLFCLFAFAHAIHEWCELFIILELPATAGDHQLLISALKLIPNFISFCFLLFFGVALVQLQGKTRRTWLWALAILLPALWLIMLLISGFNPASSELQHVDFRMRNLVGFPAAILTGIGFILYSRKVHSLSEHGSRNFSRAGISIIVYGIVAGLIPSRSMLLDSIQVEVLRGAAAFCVLHFIMKALHVFDLEWQLSVEDRLRRFAQTEKLTALGKLAAGIAHEINNPLANIQLGVERIKEDLSGTPLAAQIDNRLAGIERNLDRASRIARELLHFSRHDETDQDFVAVDLNDVIHRTLTLLGPNQIDPRVRLELQPVPMVSGIPWKLEEVLLNLIINAREASPEGSQILVASKAVDSRVIVEVTDQGSGIPQENIDRIFEPFYTTKEVGKGTGLGLSICFGIMAAHGGRIEVRSEPGAGTTMSLIFPSGG